jgi:hypothetical protein
MCDLNLNTQADTKAWLLANHPDKKNSTQADVETFTDVVNCYKNREYCLGGSPTRPPLAKGVWGDASQRKKRDKIFTCMRQTENWSKILPEHKMDKASFKPDEVKAAIHNASPKLEQLFRIIAQVDANDMQTHGKYFKHFIFSDVKEEGYGAKILASAFIANGYKNLIAPKVIPGQKALKLSLVPTGADGKDKAFGLLSSSPIFNSEFNQKFKKEVLRMYNQRPENIQGENMRFIILDSGFKEGIDLFDVKYVHIFEPSMTVADLKQTIGRATRTCGQKGLNFEPNVGWPLFVYNYYIAVPEDMKEAYEVSDPNLLQYPEEDRMLFQKATKLKDATILFSGFDKTMTNLAEQLYKLAPVLSVDFELTKNIHRIDDMSYLYEQQRAQTRGSDISAASPSPPRGSTLSEASPSPPRGSTPSTPIGTAPLASRLALQGGALNDNPVQCEGKCGLRSTKAIPATVGFLYKVYVKYGHPRQNVPAKRPRAYLCAYMKSHPDYCEQVNKEWANRAAFVPYLLDQTLEKNKTTTKRTRKIKQGTYLTVKPNSVTPYLSETSSPSYVDIQPNKPPSYVDIQPNKPPSYVDIQPNKPPSYVDIKAEPTPYNTPEKGTYLDFNAEPTEYMRSTPKSSTRKSSSRKSSSRKSSTKRSHSTKKSSLKIANEIMQKLELVPYVAPTQETDYAIVKYTGKADSHLKQDKPGPPPKKLNFQHMRDFIKTNYAKNFTWGEIVVENKCIDPAQAPKAQQSQQLGGASRIMSLNPTQDFVRTFFTPQSPYKGLLVWHSVGCGKTCTAIATATASYEQEGYTILWVTRTTLKSDVYKNMFDDVCHIILAEKMKQGLIMPEDLTRRKKLLSKNWIEPISYKTFSNLLTPGAHNVYMDKLIQRNGTADILKKTLIIIDEAHKLYGGDLKAGERPDMAVMERLLQKSYDISGKDSARLLIMTATPFTNSPLELFQLINLCKEDASEKIPTDITEFKAKYMNADALLTEAGVKKLADKLSGYISYLNREQDPTQFAQPIMIEVPVIMSHLPDAELRRELFSQTDKQVNALNKMEEKALNKQDETNIKELNKRLRETQKRLKEMLKERQTHCKTIKKREDKAKCMAEIQNEVQVEINETVVTIKEELERLKRRQEDNKGLKQADQKRIKQMKEKLETLRKELLQEVMLVERCKNIKLA